MALHLKLNPKTLTNLRIIRLSFSSSSTPPPPDSTAGGDEVEVSSAAPQSQTPSPFSYFSDIKDRLKSPPSPPRRIPDRPPPPPPLAVGVHKPSPVPSFDEVRMHLTEFRQRSQNPPPPSGDRSPPQTLFFQDLFKSSVANEPEKRENLSFDSICESLKQLRKPRERESHPQSSFNPMALRSKISDQVSDALILSSRRDQLPDSIFWKELREKNKKVEEAKGLKTELLRTYGYEELGEKLRMLRPEAAARAKNKEWFSLGELNERITKLRQLEEENELRAGGVQFRDLHESLLNLRDNDAHKKVNYKIRNLF